jgi:arylsulfatase A-like enzyme
MKPATIPALSVARVALGSSASAQDGKPNILIVWGDDIGWYNPSVYNQGVMGYKTPNIDRIAHEGAMFTDWYGQQSCTAGRAVFITGQAPGSFSLGDAMAKIQQGTPHN